MEIKKGRPGGKYKYGTSLRRKICEELLEGLVTVTEVSKRYNNKPSSTTIMRWVEQYQKEQEGLVILQEMGIGKIKGQYHNQQEESPGEIASLRKELELAKLRATVLETMIDVAEEEFKIEIRKKFGTKPLGG
jgi:transposase